MKAWTIGGQTGIDGLQLRDLPEPQAGPGEIVVRTIAAGLNYRDLMVAERRYGAPQPEARVPLSDGVGIVESVGDGVTGLAVGDRVIVPNFVTWRDGSFGMAAFARDLGVTSDGWLAEKMVLPADAAIAVPDTVSDETAATLAVAGGTVWHAMVAFGQVKPGDLVLAQGTGGVAIFALQLAKAIGTQFAITSSSDAKLARAREMGADVTINYRDRPDWGAALIEATGGRGADVVIDTLGFAGLAQTIAATAVEGRIATLGALGGSPADGVPAAAQGALIGKNIIIKGIASGSRQMLIDALRTVAEAEIKTIIDREFAFADTQAAYAHLQGGGHLGKVLIRL